MALKSMTGYGRGEASAGGVKVEVELSAVNRKQFDARISLPKQLIALDSRIGELIHRRVARGSITGSVNVSASGKARLRSATVDASAAKSYVRAMRKAAKELGLKDDLGARILAYLPEVVHFESIPANSDEMWGLVEKALNKALTSLIGMRKREGRSLEDDIVRRLRKLAGLLAEIKKLARGVAEKYRLALFHRLAREGIAVDSKDQVLAKELVLFADRSDISEEIVRIESHFGQASKIMASEETAGRALDFLCQELFREINTIGSKANDAAISRHVVSFKTELECVREQVQNVE